MPRSSDNAPVGASELAVLTCPSITQRCVPSACAATCGMRSPHFAWDMHRVHRSGGSTTWSSTDITPNRNATASPFHAERWARKRRRSENATVFSLGYSL